MSMNFDKFTDRSRGFIQSAQGVASRANHQQLLPEHLLKVLIEDQEGTAARLISAGGGDPSNKNWTNYQPWMAVEQDRSFCLVA